MTLITDILIPIEDFTGEICRIDEELKCSICMSNLTNPTVIRDCSHVYCRSCIYEWFQEHKCCPICQVKYEISSRRTSPVEILINITDPEMLADVLYSMQIHI